MSFQSRDEFISAFGSEKITIARVYGKERVLPWTLHSGTTYKTNVEHFVFEVYEDFGKLDYNSDKDALASLEYHYDPATNELFINVTTDPNNSEIIATYVFFYGSAHLNIPWDLDALSPHVHYEGRIQRSPGFRHQIGIDQDLVSIIGTGSLKLINLDGGLDQIFERIIFDNQLLEIFSWNRDLDISEARPLYRGKITAKRFDSEYAWFEVKDEFVDLKSNYPLSIYGDSENVVDSVKKHYKREIYGRVDGLKLQSVDQVGNGFAISGTVSGTPVSKTLTGTGTSFLSQVSPEDRLFIGSQEFTVASVSSNTALNVERDPDFPFSNLPVRIVPSIQQRNKNRIHFVANHECARISKTLVSINQLNRVTLNNVDGLFVGDFIEFSTLERIQIKGFAPGNLVVLVKNLVSFPTVGTPVTRQPIQQIYVNGARILDADYTIQNNVDTRVVIASLAEFNIAQPKNYNISMVFTNGSRGITTSASVDLREFFKPRDWIKPDNISYTTFYEVLAVGETSITIRTNFAQANITSIIQGKHPDYITDNTVVSCDVLGQTENGLAEGPWLFSPSQILRDVLLRSGLTKINETSFSDGFLVNKQVLSVVMPTNPGQSSISYKTIIDKVARSTNSVITLDNGLNIKYEIVSPKIEDEPLEINDFDIISWDVETISGKNIRNSIVRYRLTDVDLANLEESGAEIATYTSEFVEKYIGTDNTDERDTNLYNAFEANIYANRLVYHQSVGRSDITINTDLRLENVEIGDVVLLDLKRLYRRTGSNQSKKKAMFVFGKTLDGTRTQLKLTDYGNMYNRSSIITPNDAPDWTAATDEEKIKYGYITDTQGIVNDEKSTSNIHLIS